MRQRKNKSSKNFLFLVLYNFIFVINLILIKYFITLMVETRIGVSLEFCFKKCIEIITKSQLFRIFSAFFQNALSNLVLVSFFVCLSVICITSSGSCSKTLTVFLKIQLEASLVSHILSRSGQISKICYKPRFFVRILLLSQIN